MRDNFRTMVALMLLVVSQGWVWRTFGDPFIAFYASLIVLYGSALAFDWPRPAWLGWERLRLVRGAWARLPIGAELPATTAVERLEHNVGVRVYFSAGLQMDGTERLCNGFKEGYILRILAYVCAAGYLMFSSTAGAAAPLTPVDQAFRGVAILSPFLVTFAWDISRFERQRFANRDLKAPSAVASVSARGDNPVGAPMGG